MALDFTPYFEKYEALVAEVDAVHDRVAAQFTDEVRCGKGCSDCCYALFDLTLVEALYLNARFGELFSGQDKDRVMVRADEADRQVHRIKRDAFRATQEGVPASEIIKRMAQTRLRCPLLGEDDLCALYDMRPVTCRLYGIPTAIGGEGHTCRLSGFKGGQAYPTVNIDAIHDRLLALSRELADDLDSEYEGLEAMLVPVSMALLNTYDEQYLGVRGAKEKERREKVQGLVEEARRRAGAPDCGSCGEDPSGCSGCPSSGGKAGCGGSGTTSIVLGGPDADEDPDADAAN